ncbi:MAG TPA: crotonase/enoyl-CoA hydratase family protein [Ktedonobacteraceae bacterium]|jgi:enoyl-CoA hydratase|nr:crotonase/enoyl-CoA hydratase family protein [Ktedonobacteraceae bacterium]
MAENSLVEVTQYGPIAVIQLNRSSARNAINAATARALREAWQAFEADEQASVGILTGGDQVFCAGADLQDLEGLAPEATGTNGPLGLTRLTGNKPMIAAIAGYCVAGGLELACWCDLRIADESAIFGCFERRFGVPLIDGGTQRLPQIIGLGRALELILTGRPVAAREALGMGLANEVVAPGQSVQRALELGQLIAGFPQICLRNDRQAVYRGLGNDLAKGLQLEAELGLQTLRSGESFAGAQQFQAGKGRKGTGL